MGDEGAGPKAIDVTPARLSRLVAALPATVPFVAPETIERRTGRRFRARLGANESAFGISPRAASAMADALQEASRYGDPECWDLRQAIASREGVSTAEVAVASGIDDLQGLVVRAFLDPGEVAVMSLGAYPTFAYHVVGAGGRTHGVPYRGDRNDLDALVTAAQRTGARLVFLANPDNPTGSWVGAAELARFLDALPAGTLLVLDEAYLEFAPSDRLALEPADLRLVRLRTFSKAYGMAGLRIGYAIAEGGMVAAFDRIRLHFGVNRVAQVGARASLADGPFLEGVVRAVAEGRRAYEHLARELGLGVVTSAANFVCFDLGRRERAARVLKGLLDRDIFTRTPGAPPLDRLVRVTVGKAAERALFEEALRTTLRELG
ncbi:MAG: aminotransferase class I/II-fold pyridoxal phosphate-dependent enzyme [Candidatus Dormibacteraceae bacterium]